MKVMCTLPSANRLDRDVILFVACVSVKVNLFWNKKAFPIFIIIGKHRLVVCPTALKLSVRFSAHSITFCKQKWKKDDVDRC